MKKRRNPSTPASCAAIAAALLMTIPTTRINAAQIIQTDAYRLAANQSLSNDAWIVAGSIVLEGKADNDIFILAQEPMRWKNEIPAGNIVLAGTAMNDVWAMGKKITIEGTITDHARLAAPQGVIIIDGTIGNTALLWAETIYVQSNAVLQKGAMLFAEEVIVQGACRGPMRIYAKSATLAGEFDADVNLQAKNISLLAGVNIAGTLNYTSEKELVPGDGVNVAGGLHHKPPEETTSLPVDNILLQTCLFIAGLLTCWLFWKIFPNVFEHAANLVAKSRWPCLVAGLLAVSLLITGIIISAFSLVGLPLALTLAAAAGLLIYLAKAAVALALGGMILRRTTNRARPGFAGLTIGLALLYLLTNLPGALGTLLWFAITLLGMGAIMLSLLTHTNWVKPFLTSTNTDQQPQALPKGD